MKRVRLLDRFRSGLDRRLWVITGQAAQGKTTLVGDWAETSGSATGWVDLEPEDRTLDNLVSSLARALSGVTGLAADRLVAMTAQSLYPVPGEAGLGFAAETYLAILPQSAQLVLDGLDRLGPEAPSLDLIRALIESVPLDRRLILVGRELPPELEAAVAAHDPLMVTNPDLACSVQEVEELLTLNGRSASNRPLARRVHEITGGWIGPVRLFAEITGPDGQAPDVSLARLRGELFQHIARDFFAALDEDHRDLLLSCAPFRVWIPEVLGELTGRPGIGLLLADLSRRNLFLRADRTADNGTLYRPHLLLGDFLKDLYGRTHAPEERRRYLARAGDLLADHGFREEAVAAHLEAEEFPAAGEDIKALAPAVLRAGRISDLERWLTGLPRDRIEADPWLLYYLCQVWRWRNPGELLVHQPRLVARFREIGDERGLLLGQALALDLSFVGMPWSYLESNLNRVEELMTTGDPSRFPQEHAQLLMAYGHIHAIRGYPGRAGRAGEVALTLAAQGVEESLRTRIMAMSLDASTWRGEHEQGAALCREMESREGHAEHQVNFLLNLIPRCFLHLARGDFDRADALLKEVNAEITRQGLIFLQQAYLVYRLIWAVLVGRMDKARECFGIMEALPTPFAPEYIQAEGKMILACGLARHGDPAEAREMARQAKVELESDSGRALSQWAGNNMNLVILGRQLGEPPEKLLADLRATRDFLREIGNQYWLTDCELMMALLHGDRDDRKRAGRWLTEAVARSQAKGYRLFMILRPRELAELAVLGVRLGAEEEARFLGEILVSRTEPGFGEAFDRLLRHRNRKIRNLGLGLRRARARAQAPRMRVKTLGGFEVRVGDRTLTSADWDRRQARLLLMALIALGPGWVATDKLLEALWPDSNPTAAIKTLRVTLHRLRKALEPELDPEIGSAYVERQDEALRLNPERCLVDADRFRELARGNGRTDRPTGPLLELLERAAELYKGEFLAPEPYPEWTQEPRRELADEYLRVLVRTAELQAGLDLAGPAMATYRRIIRTDPVHEPAYRELMRLQSEKGLPGEAERTYRLCRENLEAHLGVEPGPATEAAYRNLKAPAEDSS